MTRALAINGALKCFIIGRREELLKKTAASVPDGKINPLPGDVTSKESLAACAEKVKAQAGWVDVLIANSGIPGHIVKLVEGLAPLPLEDIAKNMWAPSQEDVVDSHRVIVTRTQFLVAAFLPLLDEADNCKNCAGQGEPTLCSPVVGAELPHLRRSTGGISILHHLFRRLELHDPLSGAVSLMIRLAGVGLISAAECMGSHDG